MAVSRCCMQVAPHRDDSDGWLLHRNFKPQWTEREDKWMYLSLHTQRVCFRVEYVVNMMIYYSSIQYECDSLSLSIDSEAMQVPVTASLYSQITVLRTTGRISKFQDQLSFNEARLIGWLVDVLGTRYLWTCGMDLRCGFCVGVAMTTGAGVLIFLGMITGVAIVFLVTVTAGTVVFLVTVESGTDVFFLVTTTAEAVAFVVS
mmetsp:Transcript_16627/g.46023  ORF Transcript_16627/g.46023 Transcript_16627/m.46023 type:complete len:203 (+) Transcript_16627:285-893(+)